ncbi:hypothetical protein [Mycobacterium avium]|uniref:hypothetical protein n=1 Tax=Mycobacterium avium TaxID=1764 RepID=UPI0009BFCA6A
MVGDLGALGEVVGAGVYNVYTGELGGTVVPTAAQLGLEPPRFCAACGPAQRLALSPLRGICRSSSNSRSDSAGRPSVVR